MTTYQHQPQDPDPQGLIGCVIIVMILAFLFIFGVGCTAQKPNNVHTQFDHWWTLQNHGHGQVIIHHPACPNPDHRKKQK